MRRRQRSKGLGEAEINLTPMIDICFTILIMFIVVAPLLEREEIALAAGSSQKQATSEKNQPVTLHVFADGRITLNQQTVPLSHLQGALAGIQKLYPTATPQLFHDRQATFGTYQAVKSALERAGFTKMDVILKPE